MSICDPTPASLAALVSQAGYVGAATELTIGVLSSTDVATMHRCFHKGVTTLGAERAWFASVDCNAEGFDALCLQSACDPSWTRRYLDEQLYRSDPWLQYARRHAEPVLASRLAALAAEHEATRRLAVEAGFVSCALIPAHASARPDRFGLLALGHRTPGYFEGEGFALLRICARALALELHGWWMDHRRRERLAQVRLTDEDLVLLELHAKGRNSDQIADALHVTRQSINSRFQRLNKRLHVPNRRAAAQVALECGLIDSE